MKLAVNSFELDAVVAKNAVEVELVVVDCRPVKFCKVLEPVAKKFVVVAFVKRAEREVRRPFDLVNVKFTLPPKVAPPSLNWTCVSAPPGVVPDPDIGAQTIEPSELVVRALAVLQFFIVKIANAELVAFVLVEFSAVKFWSVLDPVTRILAKVLSAANEFISPSSVVEATTMFVDPLKFTPLMVRVFCRIVAVPALPVMLPVIVLPNVFVPVKLLLFARSVEEAAVMVPEDPSDMS